MVDGNEKLWMGFVWTLIGKYQIKMGSKRVSAKKAMLGWVTSIVTDYPIKNFNTDWNNGIALCKLVDAIQPGLCPNHASLDPKKGLENCTLAMSLAEKHLNVPMVLDPSDMNNPELDELSVMTYLSYFTSPMDNELLEWIRSKIPEHNIENFTTNWNNGLALAALVDAISPGLFPDHKELQPTKALDNVKRAMAIAKSNLSVPSVIMPEEVTDPKVDELLMSTYLLGFRSTKLKLPPEARGPGLESASPNKPASFNVDASKSGPGELVVTVTGPSGKIPVDCEPSKTQDYLVTYTPTEVGEYEVAIVFEETHVSKSPYTVVVNDPSKCYVTGASLGGVGSKVNEPLDFAVDSSLAGPGKMSAILYKPDNAVEPMTSKPRQNEKGVVDLQAEPAAPGVYRLEVTWAEKPVPGSPFSIPLSDPGKCILLNKPKKDYLHRVGSSLDLTVDAAKAGPGTLTASASGPGSTLQLDTAPGKLDRWTVPFNPDKPGVYSVVLQWSGHDIKDSPLEILVIDPSLCMLEDTPKKAQVGKPVELKVHTHQPVSASLTTRVHNPRLEPLAIIA